MSLRYLEDFAAGQQIDLGEQHVTEASIIAFAREFDPQPFHTDPARARDSFFGGLVASGWHTVALYMRLLVDGLLSETASNGSPGIDSLRWLKPVRPGDTLRGRTLVLECRPSASRPEQGVIRTRGEMYNQDGDLVMTIEGANFIRRRPAGGGQRA